MDINYLAIALAVVAQFAIGAVWYSLLFGNIWAKMHDFDKMAKKQQDDMKSKMGPWYALQLLLTVLMTVVLANLLQQINGYNEYWLATLLWAGFILPAQASAAIFGGAKEGWVFQKIGISSACSLVSILVATYILISL